MSGIEAAAYAVLDRRLEAATSAPVAVALSGGGDSLALLHLAAGWCAARGRPLLALTVDHGVHPDSARWTKAAGGAAASVGADWRALRWDGAKPRIGLPAAARIARHRLLAEAAREAGASVLLIGHTRDDVLEGDLMRAGDAPTLGRLHAWSPSPVWPEGRGVFLLRPLLEVRREALRDWLRERGLRWLDDPANDDLRYARVRARNVLRPLGEKVAPEGPDEGYVSAVAISQGPALPDTRPSSVGSADSFFPEGRSDLAGGRIILWRDDLNARLLAAALLCAAGTDRPPRSEPLARLLDRLHAGPLQATLAGARIVADPKTVQIGRDAGRAGLPAVSLSPDHPIVWDGRFEITTAEPGWSVAPLAGLIARLGREDRARVAAIPAWARGALPAMTRADGAVQLPRPLGQGPGHARSLAAARLAGACGLIAREGEIGGGRDGAEASLTLCSGPSD